MPTSSITRNFVITGKNKVEAFVNALEESANADVPLRKVAARQLTDPKERSVDANGKNQRELELLERVRIKFINCEKYDMLL